MLPFEKHIEVSEAEQSAISVLAKACPDLSKQKLKFAMQYGAVWLTPSNESLQNKTQRIRRAKKLLKKGDKIHLYFDETILFSTIIPAKLISDEGLYSIWNKPSGMFSQGTKWGDHNSIARWVELFGLEKNHLEKRPTFLVHRLDRATSGIILVAHSKVATSELTQLFEKRKIKKLYNAIVTGEYPKQLVLKTLDSDIGGKKASTLVQKSNYDPEKNQSRLLVEIQTGRKHQIRIHLSELGFPIIGDRLYRKEDLKDESKPMPATPDLALESYFIEFVCPMSHEKKSFSL